VLAHDRTVLTDDDAVGIGLDLHRPADGVCPDRILVVIEPDQAGLRHRGRHRMEAVEAPGIGHQARPLGLEDAPDRLVRELRMAV
jgi:hypothetical protein